MSLLNVVKGVTILTSNPVCIPLFIKKYLIFIEYKVFILFETELKPYSYAVKIRKDQYNYSQSSIKQN